MEIAEKSLDNLEMDSFKKSFEGFRQSYLGSVGHGMAECPFKILLNTMGYTDLQSISRK